MRISIISDVHLGYGSGPEVLEDSFEAFQEALEKSMGCDAILMGGDLFDSRSPSTEILTRAMQLLIRPLSTQARTRLVQGLDKDLKGLTPLHQQGIPVVSIHGTHERRVKGLMNPIQALEKAGFLIHLHVNGVVLEKDGERLCVQGMSGVPDQFSSAVLDRWSPKPEKGCFNVLMIHQSVSPFMYANHLLPVEKLPKGFDLYILGHIHESRKAEYDGSPLIIPGSLVTTQLTKDSTSPRGFWVVDTATRDAAFIPLESPRKVYFMEHKGSQQELESDITKLLEHKHNKKPLIRVKAEVQDIQGLQARFSHKAIVSMRHAKDQAAVPQAVGIEEQTLSVKELGHQLLKENLGKLELDQELFDGVFQLLVNNEPEKALMLLRPKPS